MGRVRVPSPGVPQGPVTSRWACSFGFGTLEVGQEQAAAQGAHPALCDPGAGLSALARQLLQNSGHSA